MQFRKVLGGSAGGVGSFLVVMPGFLFAVGRFLPYQSHGGLLSSSKLLPILISK